MNKRQAIYQVLYFGMIISTALMIWKGLMVVTGSESPIVIVLSGSMEPAFYRDDLFLLTNYQKEPIRAGDITVFLHEKNDGYVKFLTKGDNNKVDDCGLYSPGQLWLEKKDVIGRARGYFSQFVSDIE
ncbi:unnamed protein product [Rotaria sp. Silwood1]|nr:unnamed protein product [Rotaria sp. Silwood1]CAF3825499.1 unnamed protein product [Rotaria sp. Silwood1]